MTEDEQAASVFGVFTTDAELRIKVWDNALVRFTGVAADEARGQKIQALFPEMVTRGLIEKLENVLSKGTVEVLAPAFHRYLIPCPPQQPSKRFQHMRQRTTIAPVIEDQKVAGLIVTIEDVTVRVETERELAELLKSSNPETRLRATQTLAEASEVDEERELVGVLGDADWRVRQAAVQGLAKRSAPEAIHALLDTMREDHRNLAVLNSALQVLTMVDVETFPTLVEFLHHSDADLRMQAALALGEQRETRAVPALLETLKDPNINVRYHVIEALGKIRDPVAVEPLAAIAESREFFLAFPAIDALRQIGERSVASRLSHLLADESLGEATAEALGELGDVTVVAPLVNQLNDSKTSALPIASALSSLYQRFDEEHREGDYIADLTRQSIQPSGVQHLLNELAEVDSANLRPLAIVIGWLRGPAVDQALVRLLAEPTVRTEVVEALTHHGEGVIQLLIDKLESDDIETQRAAISALGRLGYRRATGALTKVLKNSPRLRVEAANALAKIGDETALDALLNLIGDPEGATRQAVVGALNSIGSARMQERIRPLLKNENPLVRESAARIAGYFGYADCADLLIDCSSDEDERVRKAAVEHLPFLEDDRIMEVLADKLSTDTPKVRAAAASALGQIQGVDNMLVNALNDNDPWVRYFAAHSLGRLESSSSVSALSRIATEDPLNHVRIAALEALGQIGGNEAVEAITSQLRSNDRDVSRVAEQALGQAKKATS